MKIAGRTQKVHESTENQMLHGSLKPEFPMICKESIDTMVFFDNRDHALYADAVVDGTGYRDVMKVEDYLKNHEKVKSYSVTLGGTPLRVFLNSRSHSCLHRMDKIAYSNFY